MKPPGSFKKVIQKLKSYYGTPTMPEATDPFALIVWENIAYLVDDARRALIFDALRKQIGLNPVEILNTPVERLDEITKLGGKLFQQRSLRVRECALIALNEFGGDLKLALQLPIKKAVTALRQFPGIGEPGAEKILLLTNTYPVLALDSNGLRVLLRIGFGEEKKNYSASYKAVREATADEAGNRCDELIEAHLLLRQHGKVLCKTTKPRCDECPVNSICSYFLNN